MSVVAIVQVSALPPRKEKRQLSMERQIGAKKQADIEEVVS